MVLPFRGVTTSTESATLSFAWALADHRMTLGDDGLYHDLEGVKYRRVGEYGNYTYEQVASILEGDFNVVVFFLRWRKPWAREHWIMLILEPLPRLEH